MDGQIVTVTKDVLDRKDRRIRWVVAATYVWEGNAEPRCVDYRVQVVPRGANMSEDVRLLHAVAIPNVEGSAMTAAQAEALGEIPNAGIPNYVFIEASQARLLRAARESAKRMPARFSDSTRQALERVPVNRSGAVRRGRPPARSLGERLAILADVDAAYKAGESRGSVAEAHHMSDSSVRDLLYWARNVADPPLFSEPGHRIKGGSMTDAARRLMAETEKEGH